MSRQIRPRKASTAIAVIVDGKDEKWYIEKVKQHYPCEALRKMTIKPELPVKKSIDELFELAKNKVNEEFTKVILIIDMDDVIKDKAELCAFRNYYSKYIELNSTDTPERKKLKYGWMKKLLLITNTPCLEFWYILHFQKTEKFYPNFERMKEDMKRIPMLKDYKKAETYYNGTPDIYRRLDGEEGIRRACANSTQFSIDRCSIKGTSEMYKFFNFVDSL